MTNGGDMRNSSAKGRQVEEVMIGYADFMRLLHLKPSDYLAPGLVVRTDGVWVSSLEDGASLEFEEVAQLTEHPHKDLTKPALPFPCSLSAFRDFFNFYRIGDVVDAFQLLDFVEASRNVKRSGGAAVSDEKSTNSLLKMVIGMAIDGYGYQPGALRSTLAKDLTEALEMLAIPLDEDTVRKWLKESASVLPRTKSQ